jgi:hypothetical protein
MHELRVLAALLAAAALRLPVAAAGYDAGFQMIEEPVDPRAIAMGAAGTALDTRGFFYYNPAQPALGSANYLSFEYGQQSGDVRRAMVEGGWNFQKWYLAAGVPTTSISDIQAADEHGTLPLYFSSQTTMVALAGGVVWKGLAVGLALHGMQDRIDVYAGYALSVSAGAAYWILPGRLSVGAAGFYPRFLTTSRGMLSEEWGEGAIVNRSGRLGVAWRDSIRSIGYAAALDIVYNDALENITVPVGLEVRPVRMLAVRLGKRFNHDTDKFSFGLGFRLPPVSADVSFVVTRWVEDTGLKWLFSLAYSLPRPRPEP